MVAGWKHPIGRTWRGFLQAPASLAGGAKEAQYTLVHAKHDGRAGNGAHKVRRETAVQAHEALLDPDYAEALPEASVLELSVGQGRLS